MASAGEAAFKSISKYVRVTAARQEQGLFVSLFPHGAVIQDSGNLFLFLAAIEFQLVIHQFKSELCGDTLNQKF